MELFIVISTWAYVSIYRGVCSYVYLQKKKKMCSCELRVNVCLTCALKSVLFNMSMQCQLLKRSRVFRCANFVCDSFCVNDLLSRVLARSLFSHVMYTRVYVCMPKDLRWKVFVLMPGEFKRFFNEFVGNVVKVIAVVESYQINYHILASCIFLSS